MKPRLYFRPNVTLDHLTLDTRNGLSRAASIFYKYNQPFAVTCTSGGLEGTGSPRCDGHAFGVERPESATTLIYKECQVELGSDWRIETKNTYWRFEFNPKPLEGTPL